MVPATHTPETTQMLTGGFHIDPRGLPTPDAPRPGNYVSEFRRKHLLSQEEVGRIVSRSRGTVSAWERGAEPDLAATRLLMSITGNHELVRSLARTGPVVAGPTDALRQLLHETEVGRKVTDVSTDPRNPGERFHVSNHAARKGIALEALYELQRMNAVDLAQGGALVSPGQVQAAVMPQALTGRLERLGARYEPVTRQFADSHVPVVVTLPGVEWLVEGDALTETGPELARTSTSFKTLGTTVTMSRRLLRLGGPQAEAAIAAAITTALSRELDRVVLAGTPDHPAEPMGILNVPDLPTATSDDAAEIIATLEAAGIDQSRIGVVAGLPLKQALAAVTFDGRNAWRIENGRETCWNMPALASPAVPSDLLTP